MAGLSEATLQGDRAILSHLKALGAEPVQTDEGILVRPGRLKGVQLDLSDCPDIAPILALVCQLAEGESLLTGCRRLRLKESDRLSATVKLLNDLGGRASEDGDSIRIKGVKQLKGGTVDCARDHRMVMLAAAAGTVAESPVTVHEAEALDKSWPDFLPLYRRLGGIAE